MSLDPCLVIYQHLPHSHRHLFFYSLYRDLIEELDCPTLVSITDNQVAFFILAKDKNRHEEVKNLLHIRSNLQGLD
jgi:hypothetical protein